jgi:hypothetical protein
MEILHESSNEKFVLDKAFDFAYLSPIGSFVQSKLINKQWDDYNELYHATRLVEGLKKYTKVWVETHSIIRNDDVVGVLLMVGGEIKRLEKKYDIENESQSLLLKYFHIIDKGKGYGSFWLRSVIFPHYRKRGYKRVYVNSSHKDSFPFYERLGSHIANYEQLSDNRLYQRKGSCFLIKL